jgi:hypothetical protein
MKKYISSHIAIYIKDKQNKFKITIGLRGTGWYGRSNSCINPDHRLSANMTGRKSGVWEFGLD